MLADNYWVRASTFEREAPKNCAISRFTPLVSRGEGARGSVFFRTVARLAILSKPSARLAIFAADKVPSATSPW